MPRLKCFDTAISYTFVTTSFFDSSSVTSSWLAGIAAKQPFSCCPGSLINRGTLLRIQIAVIHLVHAWVLIVHLSGVSLCLHVEPLLLQLLLQHELLELLGAHARLLQVEITYLLIRNRQLIRELIRVLHHI